MLNRNKSVFRIEKVKFDSLLNVTHHENLILGKACEIGKNVVFNNTRLVVVAEGTKVSDNTRIANIEGRPRIIGDCISNRFESEKTFLLGTGRSGTNSFIKSLEENENHMVYHEPVREWIPLSNEFLLGKVAKSEVTKYLQVTIDSLRLDGRKSLIISDQKLVPFVEILLELYPSAKFIWLVRQPKSFVNAAYARGWFSNKEFGLKEIEDEPKVFSSEIYSQNRPNGFLLGEMSESEWVKMSSFERNCWYWFYWNRMIETSLSKIDQSKWLTLELEQLNLSTREINHFIDKQPYDYHFKITNQAKYVKDDVKGWSDERKHFVEKHCSKYYDYLKKKYSLSKSI